MTPEYILTKSLIREPFCGDNDALTNYKRGMSEIDDMQYAEDYSEPGYPKPKRGILFANWNYFPSIVVDLLERMGYEIEWSDEWATCGECYMAVRTSADSYGWVQSYYFNEHDEIICEKCTLDDPSDYLEAMTDHPSRAVTFDTDPCDHGYTLIAQDYENGFHKGQDDDPKAISKTLKARGYKGILFKIQHVQQFDIRFAVYARETPNDEVTNDGKP